MNLDLFLLADAAIVDEAGKLEIHGGGLTHVIADQLPFVLPQLCVVVRFIVDRPGDEFRPRVLRIEVVSADGEVVSEITGEVGRGPGLRWHDLADPREDHSVVVIASFRNLSFGQEGRHVVRATLEDEPRGLLAERGVVLVVRPLTN